MKTKHTAPLCTISIPWKCVWWCSSGSRMKENKMEMFHLTLWKKIFSWIFFSFFEQYQSEYHCYSKSLAFFMEAPDLQHQLSDDIRWPVSWSGVEWGGVGRGSASECLSALVLWVSSSSPTAQHFLLGSTWPSLKSRKKKWLLQDWPIMALPHIWHFQRVWGGGAGGGCFWTSLSSLTL